MRFEKKIKILVAPNAFKGCLTAPRAARHIAAGLRPKNRVALRLLPLADGGDGTLEILSSLLKCRLRRRRVIGPLGRARVSSWAFNPRTRRAVIEMARASGLALVPSARRNPLRTTSFGTGQLVRAALDAGARDIFITLGGSATVDGGLGVLQALGARVVVDGAGAPRVLLKHATGADLVRLRGLDLRSLDARLRHTRLTVLCDVANPLLGPRGAAPAFGPQKGATPRQVRVLAGGLRRLAALMAKEGRSWRFPGAGAAGGTAAALAAFAGGRVRPGVEVVFQKLNVARAVRWADRVVTGEGWVDRSSGEGKALGALARLCARHRKPLLVLAGGRARGVRVPGTFRAIGGGLSRRRSMARAPALLARAASWVTR